MESIIKWQTGEPQEQGDYVVCLKNGTVQFDSFRMFGYNKWFVFKSEYIIAWCKLTDIEPYKG